MQFISDLMLQAPIEWLHPCRECQLVWVTLRPGKFTGGQVLMQDLLLSKLVKLYILDAISCDETPNS